MIDPATLSATSFPRRLELMEMRLERMVRDMRAFRADFLRTQQDKGVLGSRGLTEYVLGIIRQDPCQGHSLHELLRAAELAGYSVPTARLMRKRLEEWRFRVGDIRYDLATGRWFGVRKEEGEK